MAERLMRQHGLADWSVEFDRAKRRAGVCRHGPKIIGLSAAVTRLHDQAEVRETVLHEIAHALAGPEHQHDDTWRRLAVSIGSTGERCVPEDAPRVEGAWLGVCAAGHEAGRHRRPERVLLCRKCRNEPLRSRVFEWTHHGRPARMHPNYTSELESLLSGQQMRRLRPREHCVIRSDGPYGGRSGVIESVGRTRYRVRLADGVVTVPFSLAEPQAPEADLGDLQQVALSLPTSDGRIVARPLSGQARELLVRDVEKLFEILLDSNTEIRPNTDEGSTSRYLSLLSLERRQVFLRSTVDVGSGRLALDVLTCRSERSDDDWSEVDSYIGVLSRAADERGFDLALRTTDELATVRIQQAQERVFVISHEEVTAHEVWERADHREGQWILGGALTPSGLRAAGQLAMIAFGSKGYNPLDVFPVFLSRSLTRNSPSRAQGELDLGI